MGRMFDDGRPHPQDLLASFSARVTAEGHVLRQSVKKTLRALGEDAAFGWNFDVSRYPLPALGRDERVDLILRARRHASIAVVACRWVDPARSCWAFGRDPCERAGRDHTPLLYDQIRYQLPNVPTLTQAMVRDAFKVTAVRAAPPESACYHLGFELGGTDHGAVDDAARRACRDHNALIDAIDANRRIMKTLVALNILPVVVTNAVLMGCDADLAQTDPDTGRAVIRAEDLREAPWVWFQYTQAPDLKHHCRRDAYPDELPEALDHEYLRTVPIVNHLHLEGFFAELDRRLTAAI